MRTRSFTFSQSERTWLHGLSLYDELKYPEGFAHFDYVNPNAPKGGTVRFDNFELNGKYFLTPALTIGAQYVFTNGHVTNSSTFGSSPKWNQFGLQTVYSLSKRTDVYLLGTFQTASGTSSTGAAAVADIGSLGDSSNNHQAVARVAIHHKF